MLINYDVNKQNGGGSSPDMSQYQKKLVPGLGISIDQATNVITATPSTAFATFDIDLTTGQLVMVYDDGYTGPNFILDQQTGNLILSI